MRPGQRNWTAGERTDELRPEKLGRLVRAETSGFGEDAGKGSGRKHESASADFTDNVTFDGGAGRANTRRLAPTPGAIRCAQRARQRERQVGSWALDAQHVVGRPVGVEVLGVGDDQPAVGRQ